MGKIKFVLAIALVSLSAYSHAAKQPERIDVSAKNDEFVSSAKGMLSQCQSAYLLEVETIKLSIDQKVLERKIAMGEGARYANMQIERMSAEREVMEKKRRDGFDYIRCTDTAKNKIKETVKGYVSTFKKDNLRSFAKQIVSQWFVTIDTVGENNFREEFSKFDKAANDLKIELAVN